MNKFAEVERRGHGEINRSQIDEAHHHGLLVHIEKQHDCEGDLLLETVHAATPKFVWDYYDSGGFWDYS